MARKIFFLRATRAHFGPSVVSVLATAHTFTLDGISARPVRVEVDVHRGLPGFAIVGLPDAAVREARERVRAALVNCGFEFPLSRIVVNLAPASATRSIPSHSSWSEALSSAAAIARSIPGPALRRLAGARLTTIRCSGNSKPQLTSAARTRSRASLTAASGRPTIVNPGRPRWTSTSTRTGRAEMPSRVKVLAVASTTTTLGSQTAPVARRK